MAQAIPIAQGALQMIDSYAKEAKLKKEAKLLEKTRPIKQTSQYDRDALALSESELANGMSPGAKQGYNDAVDRNLSTSISALLKSGGSANNIGEIYDSSEEGRQRLSMMEDQMRLNHVQSVLKEYGNMGDNEEKNWLVNQYGPYKDKMQAIGAQRQAAAQEKQAGFNTMGSGAMNLIGGGDASLFTSLLSPSSAPAQQPASIRDGATPESPSYIQPNTLAPNRAPQVPQNLLMGAIPPADTSWTTMWNNYRMPFGG